MGAHDILPGRRGGGAQPIGGGEGADKYNLNNHKQSFTILSKVEEYVVIDLIFMFQFHVRFKY